MDKLQGVLIGIFLFLVSICVYQYNTISRLNLELSLCENSQKNLADSLDVQNKAIEESRVIVKNIEVPKLEHIYVKDKTCEAELKAYKELFMELGK